MQHQTPFTARFFDELPQTLRDSLLQVARRRQFADGRCIHRRGDRSRGLSLIHSGSVRLSTTGRDGREVVLAILRAGESYGEFPLFAGLPRQFDMHALGPTEIDVIDHRVFDQLLDSEPRLSRHVIRHLAQRLYQALELLDDERRLSLPARLGKALLRLPVAPAKTHLILATQQALADELAVSRVALSAALRQLQRLGYLQTGYRAITILDPVALAEWIDSEIQLPTIT